MARLPRPRSLRYQSTRRATITRLSILCAAPAIELVIDHRFRINVQRLARRSRQSVGPRGIVSIIDSRLNNRLRQPLIVDGSAKWRLCCGASSTIVIFSDYPANSTPFCDPCGAQGQFKTYGYKVCHFVEHRLAYLFGNGHRLRCARFPARTQHGRIYRSVTVSVFCVARVVIR